jgi:hypothetical protein
MADNCTIVTDNLSDRDWRLNNLYQIVDEDGHMCKYGFNLVQRMLYTALHWLNIILKTRQHGITTFFCIMMLDFALWNRNVSCGLLCHKLDPDGKKIFRDKILFPYDHLPMVLRAEPSLKVVSRGTERIEFANGSSIVLTNSMRSGTYQFGHISEYGKICAKTPEYAEEIRTGALEAVHQGSMLSIESTAEGPTGDFHDRWVSAWDRQCQGLRPGPMQWKAFFIPWWLKGSNQTDPSHARITQKEQAYLDKVEMQGSDSITGDPGNPIKLNARQRAWYYHKSASLKGKMSQEHPSTPDEAFTSTVEGSFWGGVILELKRRNPPQITSVPYDTYLPVHTVHDCGHHWAIWFVQDPLGVYPRFIRYIEDIGKGVEYYIDLLNKLSADYGYRYGSHIVPFDIDNNGVRSVTGETILERAQALQFEFTVIQRITSASDIIEETRVGLSNVYIDNELCADGIKSLVNFKRPIIRALSTDDKPVYQEGKYVHDWASHGATAMYHFFEARKVGTNFEPRDTEDIAYYRSLANKHKRPA